MIRMEYKIIVKDIPPSNNKYIGNSNSFRLYAKEKEKWHLLVKAAINAKPNKPLEKAVVRIKYFFKDKRRRDPDNYSGKMILDPLVREGILQDDSFNNIKLVLDSEYDKENPRTEIDITEV